VLPLSPYQRIVFDLTLRVVIVIVIVVCSIRMFFLAHSDGHPECSQVSDCFKLCYFMILHVHLIAMGNCAKTM